MKIMRCIICKRMRKCIWDVCEDCYYDRRAEVNDLTATTNGL